MPPLLQSPALSGLKRASLSADGLLPLPLLNLHLAQPEPEEDRREEEDTHGHVSIEHEARKGFAQFGVWSSPSCGALLHVRPAWLCPTTARCPRLTPAAGGGAAHPARDHGAAAWRCGRRLGVALEAAVPLLQHTAQRRCPSGLRSPLVQTRERLSVPACTAWSHPCDARCRVARQRTHLFHPACRRHAMPCPLLSCWWAGRLPNGHSGAQLQPEIKPRALGGRSGTSWQPCEQGGRASTCAGAASPAMATHALCKSFSRFPVFAAPHSSQPPPAPRLSKQAP